MAASRGEWLTSRNQHQHQHHEVYTRDHRRSRLQEEQPNDPAAMARKRPRASAWSSDWGDYERENDRFAANIAASSAVGPRRILRDDRNRASGSSSSSSLGGRPYETAAGGASWTSRGGGPSNLTPTGGPGPLSPPPPPLDPSRYGPSMSNPSPTVHLPPDEAGTLNNEQRLVVESVLSGHGTFFTGPAGSGKSHVLGTILRCNELGIGGVGGRPRKIVVTATTGIAACNVGGTTIHSFAGAGVGDAALQDMVGKVMGNPYSKKRWEETDVLVIDEVSMMPSFFLDALEFVASRARNDRRPFGGIQLVLCGDFFQLPPVNLGKGVGEGKGGRGRGGRQFGRGAGTGGGGRGGGRGGDDRGTIGFAFEAKCWPRVIKSSILLTEVIRQKGDATLAAILNEARVGELSRRSIDILRTHASLGGPGRRGGDASAIKPTLLECRNAQVDRANQREMEQLDGPTHAYDSRDRAISASHESQLNHCRAPKRLELKVGAQVILLKNLDPDRGLVNGSRGVVVDFRRHPQRGSGDLPREWRELELPVVRFDAIRVTGKRSGDEEEDEEGSELKLIEPAEWTNKVGDTTVSSRVQIPLRLAWALSVHKSQGMTIPHLTVSLRGVFEYGQAYVALSRATILSLLTLRDFDERAFRAHPKVKDFYRLLEGKNVPETKVPGVGGVAGGTRLVETDSSICTPATAAAATTIKGASHGAMTTPTMTEEQIQRMEENRQRALAIQKKKQAAASARGSSGVSPCVGSTQPAQLQRRPW